MELPGFEERRLIARGFHQNQMGDEDSRVDSYSPVVSFRAELEEESWLTDESWTAIVGYMAELALPGEG